MYSPTPAAPVDRQPGGKPLISTIVPAFNGEEYLAEALQSALNQDWPAHEVIVVDDGSTDSTPRILDEFSSDLEWIRQENRGTAAARNLGVEHSKGVYLAFLDQDDVWQPGKLSAQMDAFVADPGLEICFGHVRQFLSPDIEDDLASRLHCAAEPLPGLLATAMLVRRDAFDRIGPFDSRWHLGEWSNWYLRAVDAGARTTTLPSVVARRRIHAGNKGVVDRSRLGEYPRLLKAALDKRRHRV